MSIASPTNLPIFANPAPDETLYSVISRSFKLNGDRSSSSFLAKTFGTKHAIIATGLPSRISELIKCLKYNSINIHENDIINNLTLYPYFSTFLTPKSAELLKYKMLSSDGRSIKIGTGLVAQGLGAAEPLRQCDSCRNSDFQKYGQPYWHRSHQLPKVSVCYIHNEPLFEVRGPAHNIARHLLMLPSSTNSPPQLFYRSNNNSPSQTRNPLNYEFAVWSHFVLSTQLAPRHLEDFRNLYVKRLIDFGFSSSNGRIRQRELTNYILNYHHNFKYLIGSTDLAHLTSGIIPWATKLVRKPKAAQHPLHHILFTMAIFYNWETFLTEINHPEPIVKNNKILNKVDKTNLIKSLIEQHNYSLRKTALQVGLSVTTVGIIAKQLGLKTFVKPKHIDSAKTQATREQLAHGTPIAKIALELHLSEASVRRIKRIYSDTAKLREKVLFSKERIKRQKQLLNKVSELYLKDRQSIRRLCQKDVVWFQRHDKIWLNQFLARYPSTSNTPHPRVDWIQRDHDFLRKLITAHQEILSNVSNPARVSKAELGHRTGRLDWIGKHLKKLPRCLFYINHIVETNLDFKIRRINCAKKEPHSQDKSISNCQTHHLVLIKKNK